MVPYGGDITPTMIAPLISSVMLVKSLTWTLKIMKILFYLVILIQLSLIILRMDFVKCTTFTI